MSEAACSKSSSSSWDAARRAASRRAKPPGPASKPSCSNGIPSSASSAFARPACDLDSVRPSICRRRSSIAIPRRLRCAACRGSASIFRSGRRTRRRAKSSTARSQAWLAPKAPRSARRRCFAATSATATQRSSSSPTYAAASGTRSERAAVLLAQGSSARLETQPLTYDKWSAGLITCYQYRVYLDAPAVAETYGLLEMHYYVTRTGRNVIAWMFPKRDHLSIGLGVAGKVSGKRTACRTRCIFADGRCPALSRRRVYACARKVICCTEGRRGRVSVTAT